MVQLVLASASAARLRLLQIAGIEPLVCKSDFDESSIQSADPVELVEKLALAKAQVVAGKFQEGLILGCDSVLAFGGEIYGKPQSREEAIARWQQFRANVGILYTGHALIELPGGRQRVRYGATKVYFARVSDRQIEAYVASGEPLHCAGSFALEGRGGLFIEKLEGCHSNVIGLSLPLLRGMFEELGYDIVDFWQS